MSVSSCCSCSSCSSSTSPSVPASFIGLAAHSPTSSITVLGYTPRPLQPYDVTIAITHCGICHSDLHSIHNDWHSTHYPVIAGHEVIGTIIEMGSDVSHLHAPLRLGMRVGVGPTAGSCYKCQDCKRGDTQLCTKTIGTYNSKDGVGCRTYGGFASHMRVDCRHVYIIPDELSSVDAAPLLCAGITVWSPLRRHVQKGQRVGILGIGGLGHLALQFANKLGAHTIALSSSHNKAQEAAQFGAHEFLVTSDRAAMNKYRRELDFILVTVNVNLKWEAYLSLLKPNGQLCFVGLPPTLQLNPAQLVLKRLSITGSPTGNREEVKEMLSFCVTHSIRPRVEVTDLSATCLDAALTRVAENQARYRIVMKAKL